MQKMQCECVCFGSVTSFVDHNTFSLERANINAPFAGTNVISDCSYHSFPVYLTFCNWCKTKVAQCLFLFSYIYFV